MRLIEHLEFTVAAGTDLSNMAVSSGNEIADALTEYSLFVLRVAVEASLPGETSAMQRPMLPDWLILITLGQGSVRQGAEQRD